MMCQELSAELADFDLHKEKELKQALLDYAAAQLERHEKVGVAPLEWVWPPRVGGASMPLTLLPLTITVSGKVVCDEIHPGLSN